MATGQGPQMIDEVVVVVKVVKVKRLIVAKDLAIQTSIYLVPVLFIQVLAGGIEVQGAKLDVYTFLTQHQRNAC